MQGSGATLQGVDSRGRSLAALSRAAQSKEDYEGRRKQQVDADEWRRSNQAGRDTKRKEAADNSDDGHGSQARSKSPTPHANHATESAGAAASSQQHASAPACRPSERLSPPQDQGSSLIPSYELVPEHKLPPYFGPRLYCIEQGAPSYVACMGCGRYAAKRWATPSDPCDLQGHKRLAVLSRIPAGRHLAAGKHEGYFEDHMASFEPAELHLLRAELSA
eukprot:1199553-Amphidinium_carterae.1